MARKTVTDIVSGRDFATGRWYAACYSARIGRIEQWGLTELDALQNLRAAVYVQGDKWPEITIET